MVSISGITNVVKTAYKYGKQVLKATPELTFGTSADTVGKAMRTAYKSGSSLSEVAKVGLQGINKAANNGSFLTRMGKNIKNLIPDLKQYIKAGQKLAVRKGKSNMWGTFKGLTKGLGKKLPFIFAALMLVGEIPNIYKATKEKGLWQGLKETAKPIAKLAGAGVGSAIGSAICPGIGSFIGWIAGEWLVGKIVGKSYSEKKAEEEAEANTQNQEGLNTQTQQMVNSYPQTTVTATPQAQVPFGSYNPYTYNNNTFNDPYQNDIFLNQLPFNTIA